MHKNMLLTVSKTTRLKSLRRASSPKRNKNNPKQKKCPAAREDGQGSNKENQSSSPEETEANPKNVSTGAKSVTLSEAKPQIHGPERTVPMAQVTQPAECERTIRHIERRHKFIKGCKTTTTTPSEQS